MICNSSSWRRSSGETEEEEEVGSQRGRGEVLLGMASQIDHFGSLEEDGSAC